MRPVIGVMGGHQATPQVSALAEKLGAAIAKEGWIVLNGGRPHGVMQAVTMGARKVGGFVVGVHPDGPGAPAAEGLDLVIRTGIGYARNMVNVLSSDVVIAMFGAEGTMTEVAYAVGMGRPTILLGFDDKGWFADRVKRADSLEQCIEMARAILGDKGFD